MNKLRLGKYILWKLFGQLRVIVPIAAYLLICQILLLRKPIEGLPTVILGLVAVVLGLAIFLEGLEIGLMSIGQKVGNLLPRRVPLWATLIVGLVLGIGVTFAEPSIEALQELGELLDVDIDPHLFLILQDPYAIVLTGFVGLGVGIGCALGILRMSNGYRLKPMIYTALVPVILMSAYMTWIDPGLSGLLELCWDTGAVTTGPVTVPIVLSLGIGVAAAKENNNKLAGFGLVTLASLYPIFMVQVLCIAFKAIFSREQILDMVDDDHDDHDSWNEMSPVKELLDSLRAVGPLVIIMMFLLFVVLKVMMPTVHMEGRILRFFQQEKFDEQETQQMQREFDNDTTMTGEYILTPAGRQSVAVDDDFLYIHPPLPSIDVWHPKGGKTPVIVGLLMSFIGMFLFTIGLNFGLDELGKQSGESIPALFTETESEPTSPFYSYPLGLGICLLFVFVLGLMATIAEPALLILGQTVEELTDGAIGKYLLIGVVALGVGIGIFAATIKVIYMIPVIYMLLPAYSVAILLTYISDDDFVGVAWDSAGVTTGPVTVPLILTLGISFGTELETIGFGILALASVGPIISVLMVGLISLRNKGPDLSEETDSLREKIFVRKTSKGGLTSGGGIVEDIDYDPLSRRPKVNIVSELP